jgi:hypothetical protein
MKKSICLLVISFLFSIPSFAEELQRFSLDDVSAVSPIIQTDSEIKTEGGASTRITARRPVTVFIAESVDINSENAKLIYKADVKSDIRGAVYLEMWAHVGGGKYFSRAMNDSIKGESDWKTIQTPFIFQKGQNPEKITLNVVIEGTGTVWVDNVVLLKEPLR